MRNLIKQVNARDNMPSGGLTDVADASDPRNSGDEGDDKDPRIVGLIYGMTVNLHIFINDGETKPSAETKERMDDINAIFGNKNIDFLYMNMHGESIYFHLRTHDLGNIYMYLLSPDLCDVRYTTLPSLGINACKFYRDAYKVMFKRKTNNNTHKAIMTLVNCGEFNIVYKTVCMMCFTLINEHAGVVVFCRRCKERFIEYAIMFMYGQQSTLITTLRRIYEVVHAGMHTGIDKTSFYDLLYDANKLWVTYIFIINSSFAENMHSASEDKVQDMDEEARNKYENDKIISGCFHNFLKHMEIAETTEDSNVVSREVIINK